MTPRWDRIRTIASKELRESFRDRRTLFLMVLLPLLLYPLLFLLVAQVATVQMAAIEADVSEIEVVGGELAPALVETLMADETLDVTVVEAPSERLGAGVDAVVHVLTWPDPSGVEGMGKVVVSYLSIDEASNSAAGRVNERVATWSSAELQRRLEVLELDATTIQPAMVSLSDNANTVERGGYFLGSILPMLVVMMVLLGAYYPAIDLSAGEKERRTIQTLFTAPVSTFEVVAGKYLSVVSIAMVSGLANLLSMALLFGQNLLMGDLAAQIDMTIAPDRILLLFGVILMVAFFFSGVLLAVAVLAPTFKDAQTYISPIYLLVMIPAVIAQMPGFELNQTTALIPAVNVILLMKDILVIGFVPETFFLVLAASAVYTSLMVVLTGYLFGLESVMAGEGDLNLLTRRGSRDAPIPSISEGIVWYGVLFVLLFYAGTAMQASAPLWGLAGTLWLVLFAPTVGLARYLKLDLKATFSLARPGARPLAASVILGVSAWAVVAQLNQWLSPFEMPAEMAEQMAGAFGEPSGALDWIVLVLLVSISPAIAEESVFRGWIFSALRDRTSPATVIGVTALLFGVFHLSIYRIIPTTLLGVVMGILVWRSRSIWTSAVFHALNNGAALALLAFAPSDAASDGSLPLWMFGAGVVGVILGFGLLFSAPVAPDPAPSRAT